MGDGFQKALDDIKEYGCHILQVFEDEFGPGFCYSIGIQKTSGAPELIVIGLQNQISASIINEYNRRTNMGELFQEDTFYDGFLEGFPVIFKKIDKKHYDAYLGRALWLYQGDNFDVFQLIYPTTSGIWPWDPEAPESFINSNPALYSNK